MVPRIEAGVIQTQMMFGPVVTVQVTSWPQQMLEELLEIVKEGAGLMVTIIGSDGVGQEAVTTV